LDELDQFDCLELDYMLTLDFEVLTSEAKLSWAAGEPVRSDPAGGLAIFKVNPEGLKHIAQLGSSAERHHQVDIANVAKFVAEHGTSDIYELTTY
jgi:hypothetical protein